MPTFPLDHSPINTNPPKRPPTLPGVTPEIWRYAAPAVVACILGVEYGDVRLNDDRGYFCPGGSDELLYSSHIQDVVRAAPVRLAGDIAVYIANSNEHVGACVMAAEVAEWPGGQGPSTFDRFTTYRNVEKAAGADFVGVMSCLVPYTFAVVRAHWSAIERVASELAKHGFVSVHQLRKMVVDTYPSKDAQLVRGQTVAPDALNVKGGSDGN